jgi:hypothetical protein
LIVNGTAVKLSRNVTGGSVYVKFSTTQMLEALRFVLMQGR